MIIKVFVVALVGALAFGSGIAFAGGDDPGRSVSQSSEPTHVQLPAQTTTAAAARTSERAGCNVACKVRKLTKRVNQLQKFTNCIDVVPAASYGQDPNGGDYGFVYKDLTVPSEFLSTALDWAGPKDGVWLLDWKPRCH